MTPADANAFFAWFPGALHLAGLVFDYIVKLAPVGAFIVALNVFRRQQTDNRTAQASKTSIYTAQPFKVIRESDGQEQMCWKVGAKNYSNLPIYRVTVSIDRVWLDHSTPGEYAPWPSKVFLRIDPGEEVAVELYTKGVSNQALLGLVFEDSLGRAWYRSSDGALFPVRGKLRWSAKADRHKSRWARYRAVTPSSGGIPRRTRGVWALRRQYDKAFRKRV